MINQYVMRAAVALTITTAFTTNTGYQSIKDRIQAAKDQYEAIKQKWEPALYKPSDENLKIVIKKRSAALKNEYENAVTEADIKRIKALRDDLKALPVQFMCAELDADIKTILEFQTIAPNFLNRDHASDDACSTQQTIRSLDADNTFNALPFQELRAAIDTLPCTLQELQDCKKMGNMYKYFLAFFGGVFIANHFSLLPVSTPSN